MFLHLPSAGFSAVFGISQVFPIFTAPLIRSALQYCNYPSIWYVPFFGCFFCCNVIHTTPQNKLIILLYFVCPKNASLWIFCDFLCISRKNCKYNCDFWFHTASLLCTFTIIITGNSHFYKGASCHYVSGLSIWSQRTLWKAIRFVWEALMLHVYYKLLDKWIKNKVNTLMLAIKI